MARGRPEVPKHLAKIHARKLLERQERADLYEKGLADAAKYFAAGSFFPVDVAEGVSQGAFTPPASYKAAMMRPPVPSDYQIDEKTGKPVFKGKPPVVNPEYKGTTEHVGKQLGVDIADPGGLAPQVFSPDPFSKIHALGILGKAGLEGLGGLGALYGGLKKVGKGEKAEDVAKPIFTSPGKVAAADISKETIPANKVKNQLEGRGVSKDEMEWTGFNDWIKTKKGEVSKAEIEEFFEQNQIQVQEVVRGQISEARLEEIATKEVLNDLRQNYKDQIVDKIIQKQADEMPGGINDPAVKEAWNDSSLSSQGFLKWDDLSKDQKEGFARRYRLNPKNDLPGTSESDIANAEKQFDDLIEKWGSGEITEAEQNQLDKLFVSSYHSGPSSIDRMYQNTLAGIESGTYPIEHLNLPKDTLPTKYPQKDLQLPGGENYRELLLRVPAKKVPWTKENVVPISGEEYAKTHDPPIPDAMLVDLDAFWFFKTPDGTKRFPKKRQEGPDYTQEEVQNIWIDRQPDPKPRFKSGHWDESDVIAHIRFNERVDPDGNKVLFIEEIQSDWAHRGKDKGFREDLTKLPEGVVIDEGDEAGQYYVREVEGPNAWSGGWGFTAEPGNVNEEALKTYNKVKNDRKTQPGPFVTDAHQWTNLALKRMIRWGSDEGFDSIAWVTGKQSADRYNASKYVDNIYWNRATTRLVAIEKGGNRKVIDELVPEDKLADYIGKGPANKMLEFQPGGSYNDKILKQHADGLITADEKDFMFGSHTIEGDDLEIGGEYHKFIYDKVITDQAKKIGKKHGAKVEMGHADAGMARRGIQRGKVGSEEGEFRWRLTIGDKLDENSPVFETFEEAQEYLLKTDPDDVPGTVWKMKLTDKLKEASREGLPYYMVLPPLVIGGAAAQRTDAQKQQAKTDAQVILNQ